MSFRLSIPITIGTEGLLLRIVYSHGKGIGNFKPGHTQEYSRSANIPWNDGLFLVLRSFLRLDSGTFILSTQEGYSMGMDRTHFSPMLPTKSEFYMLTKAQGSPSSRYSADCTKLRRTSAELIVV